MGDRLKDRSKLCGKPQKKVLPSHFDYFSPSNAKASTIKVFPEVSLASLQFLQKVLKKNAGNFAALICCKARKLVHIDGRDLVFCLKFSAECNEVRFNF